MKRHWETEELVAHWTLDVEDRALLGNKTGATRLGFAVLLKFFRQEGRFPQHKNEVPSMVITFVATQVGVDASVYVRYAWQGRTIEYHRAQIREALGFCESSVADGELMQEWLVAHVLPREHQEERIREQAYQWFKRIHLEAPTPGRLTLQIRSAAHTFEQQLYETILARLTPASQASLDALLNIEEQGGENEEDGQVATLQQLRMDPGRVGLATMLQEVTLRSLQK